MLPLLASKLIPEPFVHGFTTRAGGVSAPPFDSLNLGLKWGDERERVMENRRRVVEAAQVRAIYWARQVHGRDVLTVAGSDDRDALANTAADALVSADANLAVAVYVADCLPVLFADPRTGAYAAAHAGWRGTVQGVAVATLTRMRDAFGTRAEDVRVAFGPGIGPCCFEVGVEVVDEVQAALGRTSARPDAEAAGVLVRRPERARPHVDLPALNALLLQDAGVPAASIDSLGACTRCDAARFFSYRRDQAQTGQHIGFIGRRT